ncbi:MAG TPA: D-alanyl-D-alanine carboxypeptidase family protein [Candidatus Saccharimonadales bacterium]|nr:D-alanyl-D-alanine carboxypeptidase family protein [Candidatus Saccharimonadales bacterium]
MAEFMQPQRPRRDHRQDDTYDDGFDPFGLQRPSHASSASDNAGKTLSNIDQVLAENGQRPAGASDDPMGPEEPDGTGDDDTSKAWDSSELAAAEDEGFNTEREDTSADIGGLASAEAAVGDIPYNPDDTSTWQRTRSWFGRNRKKTIAGGLVTLLLGGGVFMGIPAIGAAELVQLSQTLGKNLHITDNASSTRLGKMFGHTLGAKNISETRLGILDRTIFRGAVQNLADLGIKFNTDGSGMVKTATIDSAQLSEKYPQLKSMGAEEASSFLTKEFSLPEGSLHPINGAAGLGKVKFAVSARTLGLKGTVALTNKSLSLLDSGKIPPSMLVRVVAKAYNLPSLLHPWRGSVQEKLNTVSDRLAFNKDRVKSEVTDGLKEKISVTKAALSEKLNGGIGSVASKALVTQAELCTVRSAATEAVNFNRAAIVAPVALEALNTLAIGEQIMNGQNVSASKVEAALEGLTDSQGKSVWEGKALQATEGIANPGGPDLPSQYGQAFASTTTADNIHNALRIGGSGILTSAACSTLGQLASAVFTIGSFIVNIPDGDTLAFASYAGRTAATTAAIGGAFYGIEHELTAILKDSATIPDVLGGPLGGNLLAYGAREAGNMTARASGAIKLAGTASDLLTYNQQDQQPFQSESFFARMFDAYDSRSLVGRLITSFGSDLLSFRSMSSGLLSMTASLPNIFSSWMPHVQAADTPYNWGFDEYGIPQTLLDDPSLDDPFANANDVASALNASCLNKNNAQVPCVYSSRISACFGATLTYTPETKTSGTWDIIPGTGEPVNPNSSSYLHANCDDIGADANSATTAQKMWRRMVMFVFDTNTMKAAACYEGDDQSCTDIGMGGTYSSTQPGNIDTSTLYQDSTSVSCAAGTTDLGNATGYANGNQVPIRLCAIPDLPSSSEESTPSSAYYIQGANGDAIVNARVSGAFLSLVQAAKAAGISMHANSSFRTMAHQQALCSQNSACNGGNYTFVAKPGTSNHQMGLAIDFTMGNTSKFNDSSSTCVQVSGRCEAPGDAVWEWLNSNASNYGIKPYSAEYWHWSPTGN